MFVATHLIGFASGGRVGATVEYVTKASSTSNLFTYTFSNVSLGAAAADRHIIVCVNQYGSGAGPDSVSIAGVSATVVADGYHSPQISSSICIAAVPTGTTGTIVVTFVAGNAANCQIGVFRAVNLSSATAHDTSTATSASSGVISTSLDIPEGGFVVSCVASTNGSSWTWTAGATEQYDDHLESTVAVSGAFASYSSPQTSLTVTADCSTGSNASMASASWGSAS